MEKVSAWGAGVDRMAARASATTACAAGADIPRAVWLAVWPRLSLRRRAGETVAQAQDKSARTVASRNPGRELWPVATGQPPGSASLAAESPEPPVGLRLGRKIRLAHLVPG